MDARIRAARAADGASLTLASGWAGRERLAQATAGGGAAAGRFTDVTRTSEINALAETGVVKGCTATRFCPDARVTRAQTASLLVRAPFA